MDMSLYEVVRWGNDASEYGVDGPDTCFLVRATSVEDAAALVDPCLNDMPHERVQPWAHLVYLIGRDLSSEATPGILRGPYTQHALCHGWRYWTREVSTDDWT